MRFKPFKGKNVVRLAAFIIAFAVFFGGIVVVHSEDYKGDISDTKEQIDEANEKLSGIQQLIKERQDSLDRMASDILALEAEKISQMTDKEAAISELKELKKSIENFDDEIAAMEAKHDELEALFLDRSRAMYQSSTDFELLSVLFQSTSLFDFLRRLDIHRTMIKEDRDLMESVRESERQLEKKKEQQKIIAENKEQVLADLEQAIAELESNTDFVAENYLNLSAMIQDLEEEQNDYSSEINALTKKLNDLEKKQREAEEAARKAEEERKRKEEEARKAADAEKKRLEEEAKRAAEEAERLKREAEAAARAKEEAAQEAGEAIQSHNNPADWNFCWPLANYVCFTGKFGYRVHPITGAWQLHAGVDIAAAGGTKIYAAQSGTVSMSRNNGAYGLTVIIDHGQGLQTVYGHCSQLLVSEGQHVERGQTIALVGMTGGATGNHLHFEVREWTVPVDPMPYVEGKY